MYHCFTYILEVIIHILQTACYYLKFESKSTKKVITRRWMGMYFKIMSKQILLASDQNSVIVIDNAPYHSR